MDTITLIRPQELVLTQAPAPGDPAPGHALVRVRRVGICGTDWHAFHGRQPFFTYPRVLGHELGVEVERVNDPQSDLKPGDRCAIEPYLNCGECSACRRGAINCCENLKVLGVHIDGGMRSQIIVPTQKLHRSMTLTLDQLALVETLAIGCHAVGRAQLQRDEWTLVLGAGPIGLSVVPFAQAASARVMVADVALDRLEFCRTKMNVSHVLTANDELLQRIRDLTGGDLPTAVIDATGNAASMSRCFDLVAHAGRIVFVGLFQGDITFNDPNFHRREITLMASRNALSNDFTRIIDMIERDVIDTTPWITHRASCDQLLRSIPNWLRPDAHLLKAVVEF
jgi:2-desacetyl-2-hydroxyethyl bacteriochlorophyllide A dehydrogenase